MKNVYIKDDYERKKVHVMEDGLEYKRYKQTAPKTLYNKYLNFGKELELWSRNYK
ncbi:hypothetical protein Q5M85_03115 [Paraclostridium bifermentans]|nr:hypothetical protein [Paraclostridium bifermentans]